VILALTSFLLDRQNMAEGANRKRSTAWIPIAWNATWRHGGSTASSPSMIKAGWTNMETKESERRVRIPSDVRLTRRG
jgi:hypothetical protein